MRLTAESMKFISFFPLQAPERVNCRAPDCDKTFSYQSARNLHEKRFHPGSGLQEDDLQGNFSCPHEGCTSTFKTKSYMNEHLEGCDHRPGGAVMYECPFCGKEYKKKYINIHKRNQHNWSRTSGEKKKKMSPRKKPKKGDK